MSVVEWVRVNRASPCPVCGRDHYCSVSADGGLVYCTKEPSDTPGKDGVGWVHKLRAPEHRNGHANGHARAPRVVGTTRYEIRDGDGALVAVHVRRDLSDGSKRVWWELPDGTKGLGGRKPTELPLYGAERLAGLAPGTLVVVCEGEKATEAVWGLGLAAVGTVTGADTIPEQAALDDLTDFRPLLWPDNDEKGRQHMERLGRRLVGEWPPMVLAWPDAPEKGDAADFVAAGLGKDELRALYRDAVVVTEAPAEPEPTAAPAFALTDLGNAERLVARHGDDVRWCDSMGRWFHWTGVHWRQVGPTILTDLAKGTVRAIAAEAEAATDPDRQAALLKWAKASESGRAIASMVSLTKTVTGPIAVDGDDLDADPLLLGVENGVVDLRTGAGRPPDRGDLVTKSCRAPFDAGAACPRWEAFLEQVFGGDAELVAYVQRAVGYSLTGSTAERVIFILHGAGANGKTTFQEVVAHILGTYAMSTPVETLIARKDRGVHQGGHGRRPGPSPLPAPGVLRVHPAAQAVAGDQPPARDRRRRQVRLVAHPPDPVRGPVPEGGAGPRPQGEADRRGAGHPGLGRPRLPRVAAPGAARAAVRPRREQAVRGGRGRPGCLPRRPRRRRAERLLLGDRPLQGVQGVGRVARRGEAEREGVLSGDGRAPRDPPIAHGRGGNARVLRRPAPRRRRRRRTGP
jgi:hypothetical protein